MAIWWYTGIFVPQIFRQTHLFVCDLDCWMFRLTRLSCLRIPVVEKIILPGNLGICQIRIINWSWPEYQNISSQPMRDCQRHLTYSKMMMRFESHELVSEYDVEFLKRSFWMRLSFWIRHHLCVALSYSKLLMWCFPMNPKSSPSSWLV